VAGHDVVQVDVEKHVARERDRAIAEDVDERMAGVAVEGAHAEACVRPTVLQRRQQQRQVGRVVLEIGVEDRCELAVRLGEGCSDGGALAQVLSVREKPQALVAFQGSQDRPRAVGGTVVDHDQLERHRQPRCEHLRDRVADALALVIDRHQNGEHLLGWSQAGGPHRALAARAGAFTAPLWHQVPSRQ
jgi:hypothetical protein